ncbi:tetratricopeptide repeat protein [Congregibacter sp.]|uniref:tetratricopeptide repeat protein n=1 Tax=Congregibacter sp. TaxID=2744308 RepID=UPI0039E2D834
MLNVDKGELDQQLTMQWEFESAVRSAFARSDYSAVILSVENMRSGLALSPGVRGIHSAALSLSGVEVSEHYESLLQLADDLSADEARLIVDALLSADKEDWAASICERALIGSPDDVGLIEALGRIRVQHGRDDMAVRYFERSLALRALAELPVEPRILDETARSYLALQRYADAAELYTRYPDTGGELAGLAALHALLNVGRVDTAISMLESVSLPSSSSALFRARILLLAGFPERSLKALHDAEGIRSQVAARIRMQIVAALAVGDVAQSRSYLQRLEGIPGGMTIDPSLYALVYVAEGKVEAARDALRRSSAPLGEMAQQPELGSALSRPGDVPQLAIAYFRHQLGFFTLASKELSSLSGPQGQSPLANLLMADSAYRSGDWDKALKGYRVLTEQLPKAVSLRFAMANVLMQSGEREAAQAMLAGVVEQRPDYTAAQFTNVSLLLETGRTDEAIEAIMWSLNFKPDSVVLHELLVTAYIQVGDVGAAQKALARLRTIAGSESTALWRLDGKLAVLEGAPERARDSFEKALRQQFDRPDVMRELADVYDDLNRARLGSGFRSLASMLEDPVAHR